MADVIGPFDGTIWTQDAWYRHAPKWAPSGVNGSPAASTSTGDLPFSNSGLSVGVGNGRAWVRGAGFERVDGVILQSPFAANTNASLSRRDRLVLRRDLAAKTLAPTVLLGTASASPAAQALTQNETGQWDLPLFSWLTPPNSGTNLTSIVDERGWITTRTPLLAFGATAARDANFPTPVDGDRCSLSSYEQVYRSGSWRGVGSVPHNTTAALDTAFHTATVSAYTALMSLTVADPGFPYQLMCSASLLLNISNGVSLLAQIQVGGTALSPQGQLFTAPSDVTSVLLNTPAPGLTGTLAGSSIVTAGVFINANPGGSAFGFNAQNATLYNQLVALVVPA